MMLAWVFRNMWSLVFHSKLGLQNIFIKLKKNAIQLLNIEKNRTIDLAIQVYLSLLALNNKTSEITRSCANPALLFYLGLKYKTCSQIRLQLLQAALRTCELQVNSCSSILFWAFTRRCLLVYLPTHFNRIRT